MISIKKFVFSKALCKIAGHSWGGCKCTRCGEMRDEGHEFQPIDGKCEQQCSICGKTERLPHQWDCNKCTRCGAVRSSIDKLREFIIKHGAFLHLEKEKNRALLWAGLFIIAGFIFIGIMATVETKQNGNGEVYAPASSSNFADENNRVIVDELQEAAPTPHPVEPPETQEEQKGHEVVGEQSSTPTPAPASMPSPVEHPETQDEQKGHEIAEEQSSIPAPTPVSTPTEAQEQTKSSLAPEATPAPQNNTSDNQGLTVYITDTGKRYHLGNCRTLKQSKYPISIESAKNQGYTSCGLCNPPH